MPVETFEDPRFPPISEHPTHALPEGRFPPVYPRDWHTRHLPKTEPMDMERAASVALWVDAERFLLEQERLGDEAKALEVSGKLGFGDDALGSVSLRFDTSTISCGVTVDDPQWHTVQSMIEVLKRFHPRLFPRSKEENPDAFSFVTEGEPRSISFST